jgi:hypothetical protein
MKAGKSRMAFVAPKKLEHLVANNEGISGGFLQS